MFQKLDCATKVVDLAQFWFKFAGEIFARYHASKLRRNCSVAPRIDCRIEIKWPHSISTSGLCPEWQESGDNF